MSTLLDSPQLIGKRPIGRLHRGIVETVGHTPLVKLNRIARGLHATIALKCEFFNPLGR